MELESDETTYNPTPEEMNKEPEVLDIKHGLNFTEMPENYSIKEVLGDDQKEAGSA